MRYLLVTLALIFFQPAYAGQKYFYHFGGGGDPQGETTIFDNGLRSVGSFVGDSNWNSNILFDGGHRMTEKILTGKYKRAKSIGSFTEINFNQYLNELEQKIINGEIGAGDQLMVMFDSHGAEQKIYEKTHSIAYTQGVANNPNTLRGARTLSLDRMKNLMRLAKANKVKLALMDFSCHSGNTQKLADGHACIISATGPKHYSFSGSGSFLGFTWASTFSDKFFKLMDQGENLEDIYLEARTVGDNPGFPMISTEEGRSVQIYLYHLLTPFLYFDDADSRTDKLHGEYSYNNIDHIVCSKEKDFAKLIDLLENLSSIYGHMFQKDFNQEDNLFHHERDLFKKLIQSLNRYRKYQRKFEAGFKSTAMLNTKMSAYLKQLPEEIQNLFAYRALEAVLTADYDKSIEEIEGNLKNSKFPQSRDFFIGELKELKQQKKVLRQFSKTLSRDERDALNDHRKMLNNSDKSLSLASSVSGASKKVYSFLYKQAKTIRNNKTNPCREFKL